MRARAGGSPAGRHVLVMAKEPVPGRVKTRLCPPCSPEEAAAVAEAALADTLAAVAACHAEVKVVALDGRPGPWLPPGMRVVAQRGNGLAERLAHAWVDVRPWSGGCGIQIGMDTPQVTGEDLDDLLGVLGAPAPGTAGRAALGMALDGGWWAIGLPGTDPDAVFAGIAMSTAGTGRAQAERLRRLGLDIAYGPPRRDIDRFEDLVEVGRAIPDSCTAAVLRALTRHGAPAVALAMAASVAG